MLQALPFLLFTTLLLPLMALATRRHQTSGALTPDEMPSTRSMALQAIAAQAVLFLLAWLAANGLGLAVSWRAELTTTTLLATVAIVGGGLALAWLEARRELPPSDALRRRLREVSATDPAWLAVHVAAACGEEFAYRGVLTLLLTPSLGLPLAALASALLFGLAHLAQGVRGALASGLFGLLLQGLVQVSGGLLLAVVAHLAYDLGAAWLGRRLARA